MPKVSVIVPVYNTEKYLKKCLDSLVGQTLEDIEIICVNDGSTDNSLSIIEEYAQKDVRIKFISQENSGLSATRNNGINIATGDYVGFLDSDDYVDLDFYEKLYSAAISKSGDIACATIIRKRETSWKYRVHYTEQNVHVILSDKLYACKIPKCCYVWNKIYKAELIKKFPFKEGVFFEDVLWTPEVLKQANMLITVPNTNYYYMVNKNSIVKKRPSPQKQLDSYNAKKYIISFFEENGISLSKKEKTITKSIKYLFNIPILRLKEFEGNEVYYLFNCIPVHKKRIK